MVILPFGFVATMYPGYFWSTLDKELYTLKGSGVLRPLTPVKPSHWNDYLHGYRVSHKGVRKILRLSYLNTLTIIDSMIPVE